jgi:hypothetical protein
MRELPNLRSQTRVVKLSLPHGTGMFNHEVIVDRFIIDKNLAISVVDRDTRYVSAMFLTGSDALHIWSAILQCWSLRYMDHPTIIKHDQGSNFMSKEFQSWSAEAGISCHPIAVVQASSMGIGERIHRPLRRTFLKLKLLHPTAPKELLLDMALKGYNDSAGINGLVPTVLVYGAFPELSLKDKDSNTHAPTHSERSQMRLTAMEEYRKCIDTLRDKLTEKAQNPSIETGLKRDDPVLCWSRRHNKWDGPQDFISETPHAFFVKSRKGEVRQMHKTCVRKFVQGI